MILNDIALIKWAKEWVIPFDENNINPASIDLTIGNDFIDLLLESSCYSNDFQDITIMPGRAILATTREFIHMPEDCAGTLYLKSSLARQGLDHTLAGWIDPGFYGQITLELHTHRKISLRPGQRICQLVLQRLEEPPLHSYKVTGRYNGQIGPTKAIP